jgi:hypothetical protein
MLIGFKDEKFIKSHLAVFAVCILNRRGTMKKGVMKTIRLL